MFTKLNVRFMFRDMPCEKHASSSRMYSLNVALLQWPIFCISRSEYPDRDSAFAPPLRNEWVSIHDIGIPLYSGYRRIAAAAFKLCRMSLSVTSYLVECMKNADK